MARRRKALVVLGSFIVATVVSGAVGGSAGAQTAPTPTMTSAEPTLTSATVPAGGGEDVSGDGCIRACNGQAAT
jgi:hypothetical protein